MEDDGDVAHVVDLFLKDMDALERQQGIQSRQQTCNAGRPQVKTCGQRRIPTWLRTKRELQALRQQSEEMETRAVFLKSQQDKRCRQLGITPGRLDKLHQSKLIADREKQLQREAEEKNEALKRQLQACARVSSVLKKTITALSVQREEILDGVVPMRTSIVATDMGVQRHLTISSFNTFKILEDQVDERFHSFQPLLEEIRQASLTLDEEHVQTCGGEEDAISAMEYKCTRLLPFDAKVTRKAAWSIIEEGGGPQKQVSNVMRRSEDVHAVDSRFALPLGQGTIVAIDVHCVVKRFVIPQGCVLLAEACSEWSACHGASILWSRQSRESIWCVLRDISLVADSFGAPGCQISAKARSEAVQKPRSSSSSPDKAPLCADKDIVSSFSELVSSQRQCLENMLWDSVRGASSTLQTNTVQ